MARLHVPYIAMHMQGESPHHAGRSRYTDAVAEVTLFLRRKPSAARQSGHRRCGHSMKDSGFGKAITHNYALLARLGSIVALGAPVLVGLSRKRMIDEVLGTAPDEALNGTTALNTHRPLLKGASIIRVHDVKEAMQCVRLVAALRDGNRPFASFLPAGRALGHLLLLQRTDRPFVVHHHALRCSERMRSGVFDVPAQVAHTVAAAGHAHRHVEDLLIEALDEGEQRDTHIHVVEGDIRERGGMLARIDPHIRLGTMSLR
ncbi:MAG: dihydropteroate synthase [Flavobacteriales bacterium]|nr:dihydropteroate synthase [Flavobacteriales bacterium]